MSEKNCGYIYQHNSGVCWKPAVTTVIRGIDRVEGRCKEHEPMGDLFRAHMLQGGHSRFGIANND
jgi:hypothetical protein